MGPVVNSALKTEFDAFLRAPSPTASILLENQSPGGQIRHFREALEWIWAKNPEDVPAAFAKLEEAQKRGFWLAGFLSYELGYVLEPKLQNLLPENRDTPLLLFGVFKAPACERHKGLAQIGAGERAKCTPSLDATGFASDLAKIKDYIAAGDVYQINHTFPVQVSSGQAADSLYDRIRFASRGAYGGHLNLGPIQILSGSPELFLRKTGNTLMSRPMKGTAPRGRTNQEDEWWQKWLANDPKNRAENLMILDLIRNDIGRVAETGSVEVADQFAIERYPTLHAMTSTVSATVRSDATFEEIVTSLFPCGSITGAPKIRAMEIIRELEPNPRGIYTGAIGHLAPNGDFEFSVAIRTAVMTDQGTGLLGIGGGIVWDSDSRAEYREALLKASFLSKADAPFDLFETLRWTKENGFHLVEFHLDRLEASARYFQFIFDRDAVKSKLNTAAKDFAHEMRRVKLTLSVNGDISVTSAPFQPVSQDARYRLAVSAHLVDSGNTFLFHKTTKRVLYDAEFERLSREEGVDEVLFLNERYEVVEGSRTNLFVEKDGVLITPPVSCGLLPGCLRRALLEDKATLTLEAPLTLDDLRSADKIFVGNALRGLIRAELAEAGQPTDAVAETV